MNKLNIKEKQDFNESTIPCLDKSEISYSFQKESKKLTRLPFYKLEELKKQEEKKTKHRHKANKKEDILIPHVPVIDKTEKAGKKKKIILKKIKEEKPKTKTEYIETCKSENHIVKDDKEYGGSTQDFNKINFKTKSDYDYNLLNKNKLENHSGNSLQLLKYSTNEMPQKKIKLSRKQRKLQEAENTLASFLSKEEKNNLFNNNSSNNYNASKFMISEEGYNNLYSNSYNEKYLTSSLNLSGVNTTNNNNSNNANASNLNLNNTTVKKSDVNVNLNLLGKKKKRINKFKKAVYKYRFKKKQFIFNNLFKLDDINEKETSVNNKDDNNKIHKVPENITVEEVRKTEQISNDNLNLQLNDLVQTKKDLICNKPNFIEKTNFYSQNTDARVSNLNQSNNFTNLNSTYSTANLNYTKDNQFLQNSYSYNNNPNSFYQYNNPYMYYPQLYYEYYPMNFQYGQQPYYYNSFYNYYNSPYNNNPNSQGYYNKFNYNGNQMNSKSDINDSKKTIHPNIDRKNQNSLNHTQNKLQELNSHKKKKNKKNKTLLNKFDHIDAKIFENTSNQQKKGFLFECVDPQIKNDMPADLHTQKLNSNSNFEKNNENYLKNNPEEFKNYLKSTYHIDKDITNLSGIELNNYLKEHTLLKKVDLRSLRKIADEKTIESYIKTFEGILPDVNINKRIIREYVDQILDNEVDKKFGDFIVKMRDLYNKKKQLNPLKAKKRFVVGMREIEKFIRLDEVKCLFIVPNIEKVEGEHSLDDRLYKIFKDCQTKNIPKVFGMNKFKLGKLARKKYSCVSILAFVNVEGFEREFRELLEFAEKYRKKFYENYKNQKDEFKNNRFIDYELFDKLDQLKSN